MMQIRLFAYNTNAFNPSNPSIALFALPEVNMLLNPQSITKFNYKFVSSKARWKVHGKGFAISTNFLF